MRLINDSTGQAVITIRGSETIIHSTRLDSFFKDDGIAIPGTLLEKYGKSTIYKSDKMFQVALREIYVPHKMPRGYHWEDDPEDIQNPPLGSLRVRNWSVRPLVVKNTKTGEEALRSNGLNTSISDPVLASLLERGITIPSELQDDYEGASRVKPASMQFNRAFVRIFFPSALRDKPYEIVS